MKPNIPFNKGLYFKVLVGVLISVILVFAVAMLAFDYELTTADPVGATISSFLLAYLVHLMLWKE